MTVITETGDKTAADSPKMAAGGIITPTQGASTGHVIKPSDKPTAGLEAMTATQLDELAAKIETQRQNRPESLAKQIQALQDGLTGAHRDKDKAVDDKHEAATEANRMEAQIADIKATLRRTEFVEAATVAGFKAPAVVAQHLSGIDGDVTQLVTDLAGTGAFAMVKPPASADLGGPGSAKPVEVDPGRQALIDEIRAATGK